MSNLGKIFLYIALVGGLADIGAAFMSYQKFGTDKATLDQTQQDLSTTKTQLGAAKKAQDEATAAKQAALSELTETKAKMDDLNSKLTADESKLTDATTALAQAQDATKTAQAQLDALNKSLNGHTPDELNAAVKKAQDDLVASQSEVKIMQDQAQDAQNQIDQLKKEFKNIGPGIIPPGVSGKVTFVNRPWNFVVLNVGLTNGVVPNGELIVYRGRDFVGKVKVTSAESSSCVADILPDAKADVQVGDSVLN